MKALKLKTLISAAVLVSVTVLTACGRLGNNDAVSSQIVSATASPQASTAALVTEQTPQIEAPEATAPVTTAAPTISAKPEQPSQQTAQAEEEPRNLCTFSISCSTVLDNLSKLAREKRGLVPSDGRVMPPETVEIEEGETAFSLLQRMTRDRGIQLEYSKTPAYDSYYIEGIANLYEFDCGAVSGWMYRVNGVFPEYSASLYTLQDGDLVEWVYTCDLGRDVGGSGAEQR